MCPLGDFPVSIEASHSVHWKIADIPYGSIDLLRARGDPYLIYLVAGASFVEITSDLYTANLRAYFANDERLQRWLGERWEPEEKQHGEALKRYAETVWPEFDWQEAYRGFFAEYAPYCAVAQLGPTRALELASRCVVETGTSTFYTTLSRSSPEPVLGDIANRIRADEERHYNLFLYHYRRWAGVEHTTRRATLGALRARVGELEREDIYIAIKHVSQVLHPDRPFTTARYREVLHHYAGPIRHHCPYRRAAQMLLRPLRLGPAVQSIATPLCALAGRLMLP
jgi:hypothetical protein